LIKAVRNYLIFDFVADGGLIPFLIVIIRIGVGIVIIVDIFRLRLESLGPGNSFVSLGLIYSLRNWDRLVLVKVERSHTNAFKFQYISSVCSIIPHLCDVHLDVGEDVS
jgi:hypothetical protein